MRKEQLLKNYSKTAKTYDEYAIPQNRAAGDLIKELNGYDFKKILEIGCGTGIFTRHLFNKFKDSHITAIDISKDMIALAKKKFAYDDIEFLVADAEKLYLDDKYDLVVSNACYQWLDDLENSLKMHIDMLNSGGVMLFSMFGPRTFTELNQTLMSLNSKATIASVEFQTKTDIKGFKSNLLKFIDIHERTYKEHLPSLEALLKSIKYTGARGMGINKKIFFGPNLLKRIEKTYKEKYGEIVATYQIFFCKAIRR